MNKEDAEQERIANKNLVGQWVTHIVSNKRIKIRSIVVREESKNKFDVYVNFDGDYFESIDGLEQPWSGCNLIKLRHDFIKEK